MIEAKTTRGMGCSSYGTAGGQDRGDSMTANRPSHEVQSDKIQRKQNEPQRTWFRRLPKWLSHPGWQGVGVLVAIVALIIPLIAANSDSSDTSGQVRSSSAPSPAIAS